MANLQYVTESDFEHEVLHAGVPVLVDFTAAWCQPCKMMEPIISQLAGEWQERVKVVKLDADQNPQIMMRYQVMGIPTLILFKDGQVSERVTGYQSRDKLVAKVAPHLSL